MNPAGRSVRGVLFDLDGTLVDTAPDMGGALNSLLAEHDLPPLPAGRMRPVVSHGSAGLVGLGFGEGLDEALMARLTQRFLALYEARLCRDTRLFPGAEAVLADLRGRGTPWGIVTNKPGWLARPLMRALGLSGRAGCLVCGDCLPQRKPHPEPLYHGARALGVVPADCVYIGDAERDIQAGRAAGMATLVAAWGYLGAADDPAAWGADGTIARIGDLLGWLPAGAVRGKPRVD